MRLTLRTLLAYLDRILDPADADELQHKVEESERASLLIQRIERVLHERSTEASDIYATRHGLNPNSVAEYLDNQMQPEHVAEFERVCLESDAHLAETAACHQILTKVLGQKAEVASTLRQRLYELPAQYGGTNEQEGPANGPLADAGSGTRDGATADVAGKQWRWDPSTAEPQRAAGPQSAQVAVTSKADGAMKSNGPVPGNGPVHGNGIVKAEATARAAATPPATKGAKPAWDADERWTTAPDYLKRPRRGWWQPWAIGLAILVLLAFAGLRGMGPLDATHPLAKSLGWERYLPGAAVVAQKDDVTTGNEAGLLTSPRPTRPSERDGDPSQSADTETDNDADGDGNQAVPAAADRPPAADRERVEQAEDANQGAGDQQDESTENGLANLSNDSPSVVAEDVESVSSIAAGAGDDANESPDAGSVADDQSSDESTSDDGGANPADAEVAASEETDAPLANDENVADQGVPRAEDPSAESPSAPDPPELINPLDSAVATNQNDPVELIPALPGRDDTPEEVSDPGALGAAEGQSPEAAVEPEKPVVTDVGRFLNEQQVLVHFDPKSESWMRMSAGTPLTVGQHLLSFPTFRPPIVLASGMQVTLIGATEMEVMPPAADQTPVFQLRYGRAAVATFTSAGTRLGVQWGQGRAGTITLDDMTTLALEVQQSYLPGADPAQPENQPHDLLFVYVMSGNAQWTSASGEAVALTAGKRMALVDNLGPQLVDVAELPLWIDGRDARPRDPIAAQDLAKRLAADRPVDLVLSELSVEKRVEQRSLALCCLAYLGQLDPLLAGFADEKLRAYWPMQYEVLAHLMNQGPESVARLKSALIQHHGQEDGQLMFEMLLGYTPQQLQDGSAEALVDHLNHPSNSVRFIANQTLRTISGLPTLYQAHGNERSRRTAVAKWRTHLQQGKISYATAPELVQLLNDAKTNSTP